MNITLYHYWRSSSSWRVRWGLAIKGIEYRSIPVNLLHDEQQSKDFIHMNPAGFVPALDIGGRYFGESLAILEWLEEVFPEPALLPDDPFEKMQVRQFALQIACNTQPIQNLSVLRAHSEDKTKQSAWATMWITKGLQTYEELLKTGRPGQFTFGDSVTMADLCLVPQVYNAKRFGIDTAQWPILNGINERCLQLPTCQAAHPDRQPGAQLLA